MEISATPQRKTSLKITPPLLNSSNPWATSATDLKALYDCPYTGAVTIRTSLWQEFRQDVTTHQYAFFSTTHGACRSQINTTSYAEGRGEVVPDLDETSSLNTLGYSPVSFMNYCNMLTEMSRAGQFSQRPIKPFIVSVTGDEVQVGACLAHLMELQSQPETSSSGLELMMEVNLSCPNIPDKAPPAYDGPALMKYITVLAKIKQLHSNKRDVQVGIKTPPYTYHGQFVTLVQCLESSAELSGNCPITFITATNTLGGCLLMNESGVPVLGSGNGTGIGGMAGDALHPLALGNVKTIRQLLDASTHESIKDISIIGIGGVKDRSGYQRMKSVGAAVVGVGTALGREGLTIFKTITGESFDSEPL